MLNTFFRRRKSKKREDRSSCDEVNNDTTNVRNVAFPPLPHAHTYLDLATLLVTSPSRNLLALTVGDGQRSTSSPWLKKLPCFMTNKKLLNFYSNLWQWSVGDKCLAVYSEDGLIYDAEVIEICSDVANMCVVRYFDYGNEEQQYLTDLMPAQEENIPTHSHQVYHFQKLTSTVLTP
jgi:hypothetical protein